MNHPNATQIKERGGVLISALVFTVIISMLLAGIGTLAVSHYARATSEGDYANALYVAEAGINYEFRKITKNPVLADASNGGNGVSYPFGNGTFSVYVTNTNGSAWTIGNSMYVYSKGTVNGVTRTIKVSGKAVGSTIPDYAMFGIAEGIMNQSGTTITGDVGTNGFFTFNNGPTVTGYVDFNGPGSTWQSAPSRSYSVRNKATPLVWPTVDTLAAAAFPSGGLVWLSTHNDNGLSSPGISGSNILTSTDITLNGQAGGANYYLTGCTCNGNAKINFNNSAGPINVWVGPSGASTTFVFNGGVATVKNATDSTKKVKFFMATSSDVIFNSPTQMDFGVYAYNGRQ